MSSSQGSIKLYPLVDRACLASMPQGNVLFGCPPEVLKRVMSMGLPMPDTIVISQTHAFGHSSLLSLEFPLYHFLFVQQGLAHQRRFQVFVTEDEQPLISEMLRMTVLGPSLEEMKNAGMAPSLAREIAQETTHLALKSPEHQRPYQIGEMIQFRTLETGEECVLYPAEDDAPEVKLTRVSGDHFKLQSKTATHFVELKGDREITPPYALRHKPFDVSRGNFKLVVLGRSNGFDPTDAANGYLINANGKLLMWDAPAYLHQHLEELNVHPQQIDALIISHVHEDHIDMMETLRDTPFPLYATPEVFYSVLIKLRALMGCSMEETRQRYDFHPIRVDQPMDLHGVKAQFFHSVHAIPAVGCRMELTLDGKPGVLHISGDHLSNSVLESMRTAGGISKRRYAFISNILQGDETLVLMDAGGGLIHGEYHDYHKQALRIGFMHTNGIDDELPKHQFLLESGQQINVIP